MDENNDHMKPEATTEDPHARWMPGYVEQADIAPADDATPAQPAREPETPEDAPSQGNRRRGGAIEKIALTLSALFSPLLVPTYACAMALWITPLSLVSERSRLLVCLMVFVFTAAIPLATIIFLIRTGKVADSAITDRKQRAIPYVVTLLCYICAAVFLFTRHAPNWLVFFFGGAALAILIAIIINSAWKISAHCTSMGGLCAMLFFIAFHHLSVVAILPWLAGAVMLAGCVGSARLYLDRHTPGQVYAGFALGFVVEYISMII